MQQVYNLSNVHIGVCYKIILTSFYDLGSVYSFSVLWESLYKIGIISLLNSDRDISCCSHRPGTVVGPSGKLPFYEIDYTVPLHAFLYCIWVGSVNTLGHPRAGP